MFVWMNNRVTVWVWMWVCASERLQIVASSYKILNNQLVSYLSPPISIKDCTKPIVCTNKQYIDVRDEYRTRANILASLCNAARTSSCTRYSCQWYDPIQWVDKPIPLVCSCDSYVKSLSLCLSFIINQIF